MFFNPAESQSLIMTELRYLFILCLTLSENCTSCELQITSTSPFFSAVPWPYGILVPQPRTELEPSAVRVLTTGPPGKSLVI